MKRTEESDYELALKTYEHYEALYLEKKGNLTATEVEHIESATSWSINASERLFQAWIWYNAWKMQEAELMQKRMAQLCSTACS